jgi:hypothetical protein
LEELDRCLLRKVFSTQISCPKEALHLESGTISIGTLIKSRRVNYLHYLVKEDQKSMLSQFFHVQLNCEVRTDLTTQVRKDLNDFGIPFDLELIKSKSDYTFKRLVKVKAQEYEFYKCNSMKGSKMESTFHARLQMQTYLTLKDISPEDAKLVFAYRTCMAKFSEHFRGPHGPKMCSLCLTHLDNQQMAFNCPVIKPKLDEKGKHEYLFRSIQKIERRKHGNVRTNLKISEVLAKVGPNAPARVLAYDNASLCFVLCFELDETC